LGKEKLSEKAYELGFDYMKEYGICSQCVFAAVMDTLGIRKDDAFQAASALGGGVARSGLGTCGALTGGVMVISALHGRERSDFKDIQRKRDKAYLIAKKLYDQFVREYGSPICEDVQRRIFGRTFNFWNPDDVEQFNELGGHTDKCTRVVGLTARWTLQILPSEDIPKNR